MKKITLKFKNIEENLVLKEEGTSEEVVVDQEQTTEQEEQVTEQEEQTTQETIQEFYDFCSSELAQLIGGTVTSFISCIIAFITIYRKLKSIVTSTITKLGGSIDKTDKVVSLNKEIAVKYEELIATQSEESKKQIKSLKETYEQEINALKELHKQETEQRDKEIAELKKITATMAVISELPKAISALASGMPELVKNGTANKCATILGLNKTKVQKALESVNTTEE